jgi:hypothetical protein
VGIVLAFEAKEKIMEQWMLPIVHRLEIKDLWQQFEAGKITPAGMAREVAARLQEMTEKDYDLRQHLYFGGVIIMFEELAADAAATVIQFDRVLKALDDWGSRPPYTNWHRHRTCWIGTAYD